MRRALILLLALTFPALASLFYFYTGARVDLVEAQYGAPPPSVVPVDETPAPPEWREWAYLAANPDVVTAVRSGVFASGYEHYAKIGKAEGRTGGFPGDPRKTKSRTVAPVPAPAPVSSAPPPAQPSSPPPSFQQSSSPPAAAPAASVPPPAPAPVLRPAPAPVSTEAPSSAPSVASPKPVAASAPPPAPPPARNENAALPPKIETPKVDNAVSGVRFGRHQGFVRVVLDSAGPLDHRIAVADDGRTVTVTLPRAQWRGPVAGKADGAAPLTGYDVRDVKTAEPRLTLRAARPVTVRFSGRYPPSGGVGHRLVIDLAEK